MIQKSKIENILNTSQSDKFRAVAKELGADSDEKAFDNLLGKIARTEHMPKKTSSKRK